MKRFILIATFGLSITLGCADKEPIITIVDIGQNNRIELGKQLRIINRLSPKIVAFDFFLVPDSLYRDSILVKELAATKNTVQVVKLHGLITTPDIWDSLEVSHQKFKVFNHGFANLTTADSVIFGELPMEQLFRSKIIYSFSYVIAKNSYGVKDEYKDKGTKELKFDLNGLSKNYKLITRDDLFSGKFNKADFADKIVIMGYVGEKEDYFYLDKKKKRKVNGVEVHAAIINKIINQ